MRHLTIFKLRNLIAITGSVATEIDGALIPSRPLGYPGLWYRLRATWLVFTGRADAVVWPGGQ